MSKLSRIELISKMIRVKMVIEIGDSNNDLVLADSHNLLLETVLHLTQTLFLRLPFGQIQKPVYLVPLGKVGSYWLLYPLLNHSLIAVLTLFKNLHVISSLDLKPVFIGVYIIQGLAHSIVVPPIESSILHKFNIRVVSQTR